ncbi:MAG TPA: tetratricopeptide repeat protein, partial [Ktedonobacterales bacterium]|nr:tetratricopeptide repeat protein [Ktedonobacterales bacterium]
LFGQAVTMLQELRLEGNAAAGKLLLQASAVLAAHHQGPGAVGNEILMEIRALGGPRALAESLYFWADQEMDHGDYATARRLLEACTAAYDETDDPSLRGFPLSVLARVACAEGDVARARAYAEESLAIRRQSGLKWLVAVGLNSLGEVHRFAEDDERAQALFEQALAFYQEGGDEPGIAWTHHNLGHVALRAGDAGRAAELFRLALSARYRHRYLLGVAAELAAFAGVASAAGEHARGARLCGASEALLERIHFVLAPVDRAVYERDAAHLRAAMKVSAFAAARAEGRALPLEAAIAMALGPS